MSNLLGILVALCGAEFVHNSIEVWGVHHKLIWLEMEQTSLEHGQWPINIDSRFKMIAFHTSILVIFTGLFYLILSILGLSDRLLVITGIIILLANYICTTWRVDVYHNHVGKLISKAKK